MRLCTLVTSACVVGRILLSLRRQRVRKRDCGRNGERERVESENERLWEKGRERGMEVTAVMVKTTAHL